MQHKWTNILETAFAFSSFRRQSPTSWPCALVKHASRVKRTNVRLLLTLLCTLAMPPMSWAGPFSRNVGFYHWGGRATTSMSRGVERIAALGGHVARVTMSPLYYRDYNVGASCYPRYSLSMLALEPDVKRALDNDSIESFILTAYDGASFGDCEHPRFLNPSFYTPQNTAALINEYSDFTLYLYRTYQRTHKRFIISNWEGDNTVYCMSAYSYAVSSDFRSYCDANYSALYGNSSPAASFDGLKLWFQARQQGIADGRKRAAADGIGGMRVYFAPEFNIVHALHERAFRSVLYDVIPYVAFDYVSYSSYETVNAPALGSALTADLNIIRDIVGSTAIIIGESGFARCVWGANAATRTDEAVAAALAWGVAYVIQWNLYDQDPQNDFGLYGLDGQPTALAAFFQERFRNDIMESAR